MRFIILIVHDGNEFVGTVAPALVDAGFGVVVRSSSIAALDVLDGPDQVDLLLTRISFNRPPSGVSLAMMGKHKRRALPVLFVAQARFAEHAVHLGQFLPSTATPWEIVAAVLRMLDDGAGA